MTLEQPKTTTWDDADTSWNDERALAEDMWTLEALRGKRDPGPPPPSGWPPKSLEEALLQEHLGPGPHPSGSSQDVHGRKGPSGPVASSDSDAREEAYLAERYALRSREEFFDPAHPGQFRGWVAPSGRLYDAGTDLLGNDKWAPHGEVLQAMHAEITEPLGLPWPKTWSVTSSTEFGMGGPYNQIFNTSTENYNPEQLNTVQELMRRLYEDGQRFDYTIQGSGPLLYDRNDKRPADFAADWAAMLKEPKWVWWEPYQRWVPASDLEEGEPEFDPSQLRDAQGQWTAGGASGAVVTDPDDRRDLMLQRDTLRAKTELDDITAFNNYVPGSPTFPDGRRAMVWHWHPLAGVRDNQIDMVAKTAPNDMWKIFNYSSVSPNVTGFGYADVFAAAVKQKGLFSYRESDAVIVTPINADSKLPSSAMNQPFGEENDLTRLRTELLHKKKGARISSHIFPLADYTKEQQSRIARFRDIQAKLGEGPRRPAPPPVPLKPIQKWGGVRSWDAPALHNLHDAFGVPDSHIEMMRGEEPRLQFANKKAWERWAEGNDFKVAGPKDMPDMRGFGPFSEELLAMRRTFPEVRLNSYNVIPMLPKQDDYWAMAFSYSGQLQLNSKWWLDPASLYYYTRASTMTNFHPAGTEPVGSIATHEYAHLLEDHLLAVASRDRRWMPPPGPRGGKDGWWKPVPQAVKLKAILDKHLPRVTGKGLSDADAQRLVESLSESVSTYAKGRRPFVRYSLDNESFAEAFSSLRWSPKEKWAPPTRALNEMLTEIWKEAPEVFLGFEE